jgi:adenosylcobinamide-GDP ribazoletransferase
MLTSLFTAVSHLSVIPLGARFKKVAEGREGEVLVFFPFAGLIIGVVPAVVLVLASWLVLPNSLLPAALAVVAMAVVTGGANLVGLAGTADSAASRRPGAEALSNDPLEKIAAPGAVAVALALLVKFAAVASMTQVAVGQPSTYGAIIAILLASTLGRWAAVVLAAYTEYAHPEGGDDEWMVRYCAAREFRWALVPVAAVTGLAVVASLVNYSQLSWLQVVLASIAALVVAYSAFLYFERRFGGVTGRQLRAVMEVAEAAVLAVCAMPVLRL